MKNLILFVGMIFVLLACNNKTADVNKANNNDVLNLIVDVKVIAKPQVDPASMRVIVAKLIDRDGKATNKAAISDYSILMNWPNSKYVKDYKEKIYFIVFDSKNRKIYSTRSFNAFLELLSKFPRDIKFSRIDTCTVSRCYMPDKNLRKMENVMKMRGQSFKKGDNSINCICYCEAFGGFSFIGQPDK